MYLHTELLNQPPQEQLAMLTELDVLLDATHQLDSSDDPDRIDDVRSRIEILMDAVEILLGFEPTAIPDTTGVEGANSGPRVTR